MNALQSKIMWGRVSLDLIKIGAIDALFVPLLVAPIVIYFIRHTAELEMMNERLRESEERYRRLFETESDAIFMLEADGSRILEANLAAEKMYGYQRDEFLSMKVVDLSFEPDKTRQSVLSRDPHIPLRMHRRKDGNVFPVEIKTSYFDFHGREVMVATMRDISELKRSEEEKKKLELQLLQAQKIEAVGQLAGGVAHDFNNILTAIIGYGNLLQLSTKPEDPSRTQVDRILESAERAAQLTQSLLAFSRKQVLNMKPVQLNTIVAGHLHFLRRMIRENIEMETIIKGKAVILADAGQIEQVLMNLVTNARDAMPNGGRLTIATDEQEMTEEFIHNNGYGVPGNYAVVHVSDTGEGMDSNTKEKIFEPFFTTKEVGKGTGLGMAIVYGIVKQHGGYINVSSDVGNGTTFTIYFPVHSGRVEENVQAETRSPMKGGTETILLAEDDHALRTFFSELLTQQGYAVIVARDGEDAITKFTAHRDEIQLVILDMIMPKKGGKEVYNDIQAKKPGTRVIFASGYTEDNIQGEHLPPGSAFIAKPVVPQRFLDVIRDMLDSTLVSGKH
ncbi:MAG TPA: ATP-binding protein [Nitrospirota bacterium]|nr:ATP-binding protein [Nitrospirota bacterium]